MTFDCSHRSATVPHCSHCSLSLFPHPPYRGGGNGENGMVKTRNGEIGWDDAYAVWLKGEA